MKKILLLGTAIALLQTLAACGQKGPLYLPGSASDAAPSTAAPQPQQP